MTDNNILDLSIIEGIRALGNEGDIPFLNQIVELFYSETTKLINKIKQNYSEGDIESLQVNSHTIKGASANIGAVELSGIGAEIENICKGKSLTNIDNLIVKLEDCFERTKLALNEELKK